MKTKLLLLLAITLATLSLFAHAQAPIPVTGGSPTLVKSGFNLINAIASDGTYIYVGTNDGDLFRMSKDGTGILKIAAVGGFIENIIAFNNGNIYFGANSCRFGCGSVYVMRQDLSTGPTPVLSGIQNFMGLIGSTIYYWDADAGIKSIPIAGGAPTILLDNFFLQQFALDGSSIFLNAYAGDTLVRLDIPTKSISQVMPQAYAPATVFVDQNNVYTGNPTLVQAPKGGGANIPLLTSGTQANGEVPFLSDGQFVYYEDGPHGAGLTDTLKAIPVGGGTPITLTTTLISARIMINVNGTLIGVREQMRLGRGLSIGLI